MQKRHLIKNKFFDPRLQILFTACVCEIVNTMVYGNPVNTQGIAVVNNETGKTAKEYCNNKCKQQEEK